MPKLWPHLRRNCGPQRLARPYKHMSPLRQERVGRSVALVCLAVRSNQRRSDPPPGQRKREDAVMTVRSRTAGLAAICEVAPSMQDIHANQISNISNLFFFFFGRQCSVGFSCNCCIWLLVCACPLFSVSWHSKHPVTTVLSSIVL